MLEPHQHLGFWCLPQKLPGFPQELRWRARSEAPAGCTGEQLYLADAGPPGVVIYIYIHYYIYIIIYIIIYILLYIYITNYPKGKTATNRRCRLDRSGGIRIEKKMTKVSKFHGDQPHKLGM